MSSARQTEDVPDPNMSTTQFTSVNAGMIADSDSKSEKFSGFDGQHETINAVSKLRSEVQKHTQTVELIRGRLQGWAKGAEVELTIPGEASEVPHPEYGGRQWVTNHEGQVPFGILTEMVRLVEHKRQLIRARGQLDSLISQFDYRLAMASE